MNSFDSHSTDNGGMGVRIGVASQLSPHKSLVTTDEELARMLQQQELVFYNMAGLGDSARHSSEGGGQDTPEQLSDEELAQRLQAEEDQYADGTERMEEHLQAVPDFEALQYEDLQALGDAVGTVSKGLCSEALEQLPSQQFKDVSQSCCTERCCICQEEYSSSDDVTLLPSCNHVYHRDCIAEWLSRNNTCPYCNKEVPKLGHQA